jgi:hypothetical protein
MQGRFRITTRRVVTPGVFFKRSTAAWFLAAAAFCAGCKNPFSMREPEPPVTVRSDWTPPLRPELVLDNLSGAIRERNADNYLRCLAAGDYGAPVFRFEPDPKVAADYPGLFAAWNRDRELAAIRQVFSLVPADSTCTLTWTGTVRRFTESDSAVFVERYRLEAHHTQSGIGREFEGQAELRLAEDQRGEWSVYLWIDNAVGESRSWTTLKSAFGG